VGKKVLVKGRREGPWRNGARKYSYQSILETPFLPGGEVKKREILGEIQGRFQGVRFCRKKRRAKGGKKLKEEKIPKKLSGPP